MCRIAGIISKKAAITELDDRVRTMCRVLQHGGPDDEGVFVDADAGIVLGHRRLSIIDLSKNGHQPMQDAAHRAWITFNGEIYNYRELREELLKAGAQFISSTDTEVILAAYLHWGTGAFAKLRGMFAFALYDAASMTTYLVRDSTGIKPLYYHVNNGRLTFASEVRAFKAADAAAWPEDSWPVRFLAFGHIPEPYTTLKNVFSLQKGHYLAWRHRGETYTITQYTTTGQQAGVINDEATARRSIHDSLKAAVRRQLISDAPIGVFLSGGVDSSLLSLLANEEDGALKTISIYFNEKEYDERQFQDIVAGRIKGDKLSHLVQQHDFEAFFPHIISDMDMPTTDGINTWFISRYAHQDGLKAVLSGVGADELFGGYPSFNRIEYLRYLRRLPSGLLGAARYAGTDRYRKISFLKHDHPLADYLLLRGLFVPGDIARILDTDEAQVNAILFDDNPVPAPGGYDQEHAAWFEANIYMQNQLLRDTDVLSMSHGLEVRVPFLDEDFQAIVKSISPAIRFNKRQPKKILVDSFDKLLPPQVWNRPKMGFTFPLQEWMSKHHEVSNSNLYKGKLAQELIQKFKNGRLHWSKIFALYQIQLND